MRIYFFILAIFFVTPIHAEDQRFPFSSPEQAQQFRELTEELRCLVCQNQSLADSDAGLANDLRQMVYNLMVKGKTKEQIIEELVSRYGEFVLYRPRFNSTTYILWFAPVILFLTGLIVLIVISRRQPDKDIVNEAELQNAKKLLEENE